MAWTDAARAASAAVRRAHARGKVTPSGKKARPMQWYHGGPQKFKGRYVFTKGSPIPTSRLRGEHGTAFATTKLKLAHFYGTQYRRHGGMAVFTVKPLTRQRRIEMVSRTVLRSVKNLRVIGRLPRARGRAARGRY